MTREEWCKLVGDPELLFADGYDKAIIGVVTLLTGVKVVAYDIAGIINLLMSEGMSEPDAEEFVQVNVLGAYVGPRTPVYVPFPFRDVREQQSAPQTLVRAK